jgi:hypothetical protein
MEIEGHRELGRIGGKSIQAKRTDEFAVNKEWHI